MFNSMHLDWIFTLLPYGNRWRAERRIMHQHINSGAVSRYSDVQLERAHLLAKELVADPAHLEDRLRASFGGTVMRVFYGLEVKEKNDPYIKIAEEVMAYANLAVVPGRFLVDLIDPRKCQPSIPRGVWAKLHRSQVCAKLVPRCWISAYGFGMQRLTAEHAQEHHGLCQTGYGKRVLCQSFAFP